MTLIQDTNTPKDKSADIDKVEHLWRKRLGLSQSPLEQLQILLNDKQNWIMPTDSIMYYKYRPEFTCEIEPRDYALRHGHEIYSLVQLSQTTPIIWFDVTFKYHQTTLESLPCVSLDGSRYKTAAPNIGYLHLDNENYRYHYFNEDSIEYALHKFYDEKDSYGGADVKFKRCVLFFETEKEHKRFWAYIEEHKDYFIREINKMDDKEITFLAGDQDGLKMEYFIQEYKTIIILSRMLSDFLCGDNLFCY